MPHPFFAVRPFWRRQVDPNLLRVLRLACGAGAPSPGIFHPQYPRSRQCSVIHSLSSVLPEVQFVTRWAGHAVGTLPILLGMLLTMGTLDAATITVGQRDGDLTGSDDRVLQQAVDRVFAEGGGTVYIKSGRYVMANSLFLRSGVDVVGLGPSPILQLADAASSPLAEDAGYGVDRVLVTNPAGFRAGMGVAISDDRHNTAWYVCTRTITAVEGRTLVLDEELDLDYLASRNGKVEGVVPVIFGKRVERVRLENLLADGNRSNTPALNGCRGGAIYFWKSRDCVVDNCKARNFNGDGISYQVSPGITITRCRAYRNAGHGIHPGSGSYNTDVSECMIEDNGEVGLFLCWRVTGSRFQDNTVINNGLDGISIGHKDTDNTFVGNTVELNGRHGVHFRAETEANGGHRNTFEDNVIRDNGQKQPGDGVHVEGITRDLVFKGNTIEDTQRDGRVSQRNGIFLGAGVDGVRTRGNIIQGQSGQAMVDRSGNAGNSLQ